MQGGEQAHGRRHNFNHVMLEMQDAKLGCISEIVEDTEDAIAGEAQFCHPLKFLHDSGNRGAAIVFKKELSKLQVVAHLARKRLDVVA